MCLLLERSGGWQHENGAFSAVGPRLCNALPREVRLAPSLYTFRHQAKTFLFNQAFGLTSYTLLKGGSFWGVDGLLGVAFFLIIYFVVLCFDFVL